MSEEKIKMTVMKKWFDDILDDPNDDTTPQEMAYIMYAVLHYGLYGEKINIGEIFGQEFKGLNRAMPNIYGQIDNIKNFDPADGKKVKYDAEVVKQMRLEGLTAREIVVKLGYGEDKARSLTTTKGWKEAGRILANQKKSENTDSVQKVWKVDNIKNTDLLQKNTDLNQTVSDMSKTEKSDLSQNSTENQVVQFNF